MIAALDFILLRLKDNKTPEVLLYKRKDGVYTIIGGQIFDTAYDDGYPVDHDINTAIKRILLTKLGTEINNLEQLNRTFGSRDRDSRGWSVSIPYWGFISAEESDALSESENHKWVPIDAILETKDGQYCYKLPFDHNSLVASALEHIHRKIGYSSSVLYALPKTFKVSDIVAAYEAFGLAVSRQTIHNRIIGSGCVIEVKEDRKNSDKVAGKPAGKYMVYEKAITYFDVNVGKKIS